MMVDLFNNGTIHVTIPDGMVWISCHSDQTCLYAPAAEMTEAVQYGVCYKQQ